MLTIRISTIPFLIFLCAVTAQAEEMKEAQKTDRVEYIRLADDYSLTEVRRYRTWNPIAHALWDVEEMGIEVIAYADRDLSLKTYFVPRVITPIKIWHYPIDFVLMSPKWATYWIYAAGDRMTDHWESSLDEENLYHGVTVGLLGGTMKAFILGEIVTEFVGIGVRDLSRLLMLRPFRKHLHYPPAEEPVDVESNVQEITGELNGQ